MLQRTQTFGACPSQRICLSRPSTGLAAPKHRPLAATPPQRAYSDSTTGSSRSVLDAFFYGKAFAEVANEKLGTLADELLVQFNKADAERRQAVREFLDQVQSRAESEMLQSSATSSSAAPAGRVPATRQLPERSAATGGSGISATTAVPVQPPSPDLQETVDELRAEVAATRAQLVAFKGRRQQKPQK